MWQSKREISWECSDIIGSAKGSQISEKYWGKVGKGKRADVYLEVRKRRGHIFFEWNKCLWQKWIKSKINKYKINNDNKKQIQNMNLMLNMKDINKILANAHFKCNIFKWCEQTVFFWRKLVSKKLLEFPLSCLHFYLMNSEGEVKSPYFLQVWWVLTYTFTYLNITRYKYKSVIQWT